MTDWKKELVAAERDPRTLARRFGMSTEAFETVANRYPVSVTSYYLDLIEHPQDPIGRQCLPDPLEMVADGDLLDDPLGEQRHAVGEGLIHRYDDRVVLLISSVCPVYCRFCTRKDRVGQQGLAACGDALQQALEVIADDTNITDVLLSGGDPLMLSDDRLEDLLRRLRAIDHVETVRIGSRMPVTLPSRITPQLVNMLRRYGPIYLNTHFNHPRELTAQAAAACRLLADAGVVLGNQTVLLRGVNDDAATLRDLFKGLLRLRVRPYYLHQMDLALGTGHFRTRIEDGLVIMQQLRGPVSGLAIPQYMVDLPGGDGKVPLTPDYINRLGDHAQIRTPDGRPVLYPNRIDPG